jgi:hypothetical protein
MTYQLQSKFFRFTCIDYVAKVPSTSTSTVQPDASIDASIHDESLSEEFVSSQIAMSASQLVTPTTNTITFP